MLWFEDGNNWWNLYICEHHRQLFGRKTCPLPILPPSELITPLCLPSFLPCFLSPFLLSFNSTDRKRIAPIFLLVARSFVLLLFLLLCMSLFSCYALFMFHLVLRCVGTVQYFDQYEEYTLGAWLYIIGSIGFLGVDVLEFFTFWKVTRAIVYECDLDYIVCCG